MDKIIPFSHKLLQEVVSKKDICIDMTCGNGFDTLFLSDIARKVFAFDIQDVAIKNTKEKTKDKDNVFVILDSHENVLDYVKEPVKGAIYNLGYLPCGDKKLFTSPFSTISSLEKLLKILDVNGRIVIVCYPGFAEGMDESIKVEEYLKTLDQKKYSVVTYKFINQINNPPFIIAVERDK